MSTSNVFDGNLSKPWTEEDVPVPESDYGIFKRKCECMLQEKLSEQLIIFRLSAVWDRDCLLYTSNPESQNSSGSGRYENPESQNRRQPDQNGSVPPKMCIRDRYSFITWSQKQGARRIPKKRCAASRQKLSICGVTGLTF